MMTTYGDFSSLLELGVGTGIALSLFRAPIALRVMRISRTLDGEIRSLGGALDGFSQIKRSRFLDLKLRFEMKRSQLDKIQLPFMCASVLGAALNLIALIFVTLNSEQSIGAIKITFLLLMTVGHFVCLIVALEIMARIQLGDLSHELERIQMQTS